MFSEALAKVRALKTADPGLPLGMAVEKVVLVKPTKVAIAGEVLKVPDRMRRRRGFFPKIWHGILRPAIRLRTGGLIG